MTELEPRSVKDSTTVTGRTVFRLDPGIWKMIEEVAQFDGIEWRDWIVRVVQEYTGSDASVAKAAYIRKKAEDAFQAMLEKSTADAFARMESGEALASNHVPSADHPFVRQLIQFSEDQFATELKRASPVFRLDAEAFSIHLGHWNDIPALFIENRVKEGVSYVFVDRSVE